MYENITLYNIKNDSKYLVKNQKKIPKKYKKKYNINIVSIRISTIKEFRIH